MDEDLKLDEKRRSTLYVVPRKKFKKENDQMHFRSCSNKHILWFTINGARSFTSFALMERNKRIEEGKDFIEFAEKASLVADLNELVEELVEREQKAKEKRKSQK